MVAPVSPEVPGVEHRYVQVGGLRVHVAEAGSGPPLVLLHGWPQHWYLWRHQIPELARSYRVIAPDLRGHGWTDAPAGGYDKENLAADLIGLLDALELDRVRLVGHDWGGWTGFLACLRAPERFDRFLALNIAHPWPSRSPAARLSLWRFWYQVVVGSPLGSLLVRRTPFISRGILGTVERGALGRAERDAFADRWRDPARARASVQLYRTFLLRELPAVARGRYRDSTLTTRTRLLFGTGDPAISPRLLAGYERHAERMDVRWVPGAGHFIVDERPDRVLAEIQEFMAE
ncbi:MULTISPECIES: alpha/beta fold hydrolase [unclassified Saccharopolyspora]|uniref:alpha/beta fold hydrolase n=1 Tax=unclassified Saccharopolyspora TaxID=2646250 RepID=UPI001CD60B36|nr:MULTISPECIES: alpha/beta fold hydrolase [unclassified Saccharopolyspora]MCA1187923.1 alpha/beta fold hydrolase [Saccharopolyspora sp. 6T]MCA1279149.1 alpha/beta fold hydrolase [Saccharopolyspora sp. 7B]